MSRLKRLGVKHHCDLIKDSDSFLPKLPPQAGKLKRWARSFRKSLMVSAENGQSKFFFRSRAAISLERKRQLRTSPPYIIHPFSKFCVVKEKVFCVAWMFVFFKDPFITTFYSSQRTGNLLGNTWEVLDFVVDLLMMCYLALCFVTGTYKSQTKEVILEPNKIVRKYLATYFFFDFAGSFPFRYFTELVIGTSTVTRALLSCLHFLRFVRIKTMLNYFRTLMETFRVEDSNYELCCLVLLSVYFLHWWTCLVYLLPYLYFELSGGGEPPPTSWLVMARIHRRFGPSIGRQYIECFLSVLCHFFVAGVGMYITEHPFEQVIFSLVMVTGTFYTAYTIVVVLEMVNSANSSSTKYEELVNQLGEYMRSKKLPVDIRNRLIVYYENRFQKHYFKEKTILNTLSEHLRYEIFLHGCKGLVDKVEIFQQLSKSTVGRIIGSLRHEVFLPNDTLLKGGTDTDSIIFISSGTVTFVAAGGQEICHYQDGDFFGEIGIFVEETRGKPFGSFVALEITEIFRLQKKDLENCMMQDEEVVERFRAVARQRYEQMVEMERQEAFDEIKQKRDVLYELRMGRILEHTHRQRRQ